ncbi:MULTISPECIES: hypothetical protein [Paenibacillus]|uniref:hypothetical protein n=1 Tax=Paenibacillus TaxID=44249 RepID=UPI0004243DEE|nr:MULTISPECIES: hypothetical protein [Paenibacillus]KGP81116.1 hypothetical protein P364_0117640 [Paenibacillus sp. MAEPY2]KGP86174.1 hypothetical protein P363_0119070 [Paenibacillus sp. MAEPY1]OZQ71025.1 hypothetical protein CA599_10830 [Paenibacillus taichungensis]
MKKFIGSTAEVNQKLYGYINEFKGLILEHVEAKGMKCFLCKDTLTTDVKIETVFTGNAIHYVLMYTHEETDKSALLIWKDFLELKEIVMNTYELIESFISVELRTSSGSLTVFTMKLMYDMLNFIRGIREDEDGAEGFTYKVIYDPFIQLKSDKWIQSIIEER